MSNLKKVQAADFKAEVMDSKLPGLFAKVLRPAKLLLCDTINFGLVKSAAER